MKTLLLIFFVLGLALSFEIIQSEADSDSLKFIVTGSCSADRVKIVNQSIANCQAYGIQLSTACIKNYMFNHSNQQIWDVMAELPDKSDAKSSVWTYDDCSIRYEQYGQFKITYTIWKATGNPTIFRKLYNYVKQMFIKFIMSEEPNEDCDPNRVSAATTAINYCQNADLSLQVICIKNNIRTKLGQKWDVVGSSSSKSVYSIRYEYFNGCYVKLNNAGARNRNYLVWKAQ